MGTKKMEESVQNLEKLSVLGLRLRVKMESSSFIGDVFYYQKDTKLLILKESFHDNKKFNFRFINTNEITSINVISSKSIDEIETDTMELDFAQILKNEKNKKVVSDQKIPFIDDRVKAIYQKLS